MQFELFHYCEQFQYVSLSLALSICLMSFSDVRLRCPFTQFTNIMCYESHVNRFRDAIWRRWKQCGDIKLQNANTSVKLPFYLLNTKNIVSIPWVKSEFMPLMNFNTMTLHRLCSFLESHHIRASFYFILCAKRLKGLTFAILMHIYRAPNENVHNFVSESEATENEKWKTHFSFHCKMLYLIVYPVVSLNWKFQHPFIDCCEQLTFFFCSGNAIIRYLWTCICFSHSICEKDTQLWVFQYFPSFSRFYTLLQHV